MVTRYAGILCPHQSCLEMHQSLMPSIQWSHVFLCASGISRSAPSSTACLADTAMSPHLTYLDIIVFNNYNKLALLWGEAQKKIAYSYLKVT